MLLYIEQPFPYDLEAHPLDVHTVTARKPLFLDESAHDWRFVRLGRELGGPGRAEDLQDLDRRDLLASAGRGLTA